MPTTWTTTADLDLWGTLKLKNSNDVLRFAIDGRYYERAHQLFSRQQVQYGGQGNSQPLFRHQLADLPPSRKWEMRGMVGYPLPLGQGWRQLSNVTRTINAQGRTETFTNVLPRYVLFHAVWRLNKEPKKP